jgi:small GTP-binding protein
MDSRKVCILGDFAVGKTSLVRRFVHQQFSARYLTTVGVKVDTKEVLIAPGRGLKLAIWDLAGSDAADRLLLRYVRGAAGSLLVPNVTRAETLDGCLRLHDALTDTLGPVPYLLLVNKQDLTDQREFDAAGARTRLTDALDWLDTSALTGHGVEAVFATLVRGILDHRPGPRQ